VRNPRSHTAAYLKDVLKRRPPAKARNEAAE
jgi:hypothetical protein